MKTAIFAAVAFALAAPVGAATFDLGNADLTPAQTAEIASVLDSDESSSTIQRRIDAIVGNVTLNTSPEAAAAAEIKFIENSDLSTNEKRRLIDAVSNAAPSADVVTDAQVMFILSSDLSTNDKERKLKALFN